MAFWQKLKRFWHAPLFNKLHSVSTLYYKIKGLVLYRLVFARFGTGSYIRRPMLILNPSCIDIGDRVSIRDGARLEVVLTNTHRSPCLSIGSDTNIEQNVHIVCHNSIRIGHHVSITGYCAIVDVTHPFDSVSDVTKIGARIKDEDSFVEIGDNSFIGYGSIILPNVKVGINTIIGANSVVSTDIPDYCVAAGVPAVILKRYDWKLRAWVKSTAANLLPSAQQ